MSAADNFLFGLLRWTEKTPAVCLSMELIFVRPLCLTRFKLLLGLWLAQWRISEVLSINYNIAVTILLNTNYICSK